MARFATRLERRNQLRSLLRGCPKRLKNRPFGTTPFTVDVGSHYWRLRLFSTIVGCTPSSFLSFRSISFRFSLSNCCKALPLGIPSLFRYCLISLSEILTMTLSSSKHSSSETCCMCILNRFSA